jgi:hypothetical protein
MGYDEPPREEVKTNSGPGQTLLLIGIVAGIAIIAFGGYWLYKRNNYTEPAAESRARVVPDSTTTAADNTALAGAKPSDSTTAGKKDTALANQQARVANPADASAAKTPTPVTTTPGAIQHAVTPAPGQVLYYFVILRTENKRHALRRYNQLLGYQLNIHMDTKDSSFFKLYFPIAATIRDTTHIRDSLADVYEAKVSIEQH